MEYPKKLAQKPWIPAFQSENVVQDDAASGSGQRNLIINYLPADMTEMELCDIFSMFGDVVKYNIIRNKKTGQSLCYGFVEFGNAHAAKVAQMAWNRREIRGKYMRVEFARPRSDDIINANLYVSFLPLDFDERKLTELFGCYGAIIDTKVLRNKTTGESRGAGFVRFDQHLAAKVAKNALDQHVPLGATRPISVQWANNHIRSDKAIAHCPCSQNCHPSQHVMEETNTIQLPIKRQMEPETEEIAKRRPS